MNPFRMAHSLYLAVGMAAELADELVDHCLVNQAMHDVTSTVQRIKILLDKFCLVNQAMHDVSSTVQRIKILLDKLRVKRGAASVIASLKESKVDYTLLLYLQLPKFIREKSELISCLETICCSMQADYQSRFFYSCVWEYFENEGVQSITPGKYITAKRKEEILKEYERVRKSWGKHSPLFLQMYDTKDGGFTNHVYFIFRTVQDGIQRLLDILKTGEVVFNRQVYTACGAFEHVIGPSTVTCQLYDCEIMSSAFKEPVEEVKEMVRGFPAALANVMIREELINIEDFLMFSVKDRTRQVRDAVKISFHFTPFICAPKAIHNSALKICLKGCKDDIDEAAACIKQTGLMPGGLLPTPLRTLDYKAFNNGITTAFSRKTRFDVFPRHVYTEELCGGCTTGRKECAMDPQDLHGGNLTDKQRQMLLYRQLYTSPKQEMISYTEDATRTMSKSNEVRVFLILLGCHRDSNPYTPDESSFDDTRGGSIKAGWTQVRPLAPIGPSTTAPPRIHGPRRATPCRRGSCQH